MDPEPDDKPGMFADACAVLLILAVLAVAVLSYVILAQTTAPV